MGCVGLFFPRKEKEKNILVVMMDWIELEREGGEKGLCGRLFTYNERFGVIYI